MSACPDTTNVKLAGVHDGMGALARNTTETRPPGEKESEVLAAAFCSSDRGRSTDGPAGSTTVVALSSPPRTIFCRRLPFNNALATAVRLTLNAGSRVRISFYVEHLDANRFFGSDYEGVSLDFVI